MRHGCYYPNCPYNCNQKPITRYHRATYSITCAIRALRSRRSYAEVVKGLYSDLYESPDPHEFSADPFGTTIIQYISDEESEAEFEAEFPPPLQVHVLVETTVSWE